MERDEQTTIEQDEPQTEAPEQTPDTDGKDENGDGLKGGQATADVHGDILGV